MKSRNILILALSFVLMAWGGTSSYAQESMQDESGTRKMEILRDLSAINPTPHIKELSSIPTRFTGYPGCQKAADYIKDYYEKLGLANVKREPFTIITPVEQSASLSVGGETRVGIHCVRPNYVRTPKTPKTGITGHLIWGGDGELSDFNGMEVKGSIVLMEFNSATRWLNAAKLGAEAIIFLEPEHAFRTDAEQKYSSVPTPVPRYYLQRKELPKLVAALTERTASNLSVSDALDTVQQLSATDNEVTVTADMMWKESTVYMVSGEIPGIDPTLGRDTMVCHAYYDSTSVVPALAPGAENACGVASQLEIAEFLMKNPPRRTVKVLATPGHFQGLSGAREYAQSTIYPKRKRVTGSAQIARSGEPQFFIGLDISSRNNTLAGFFKGNFYNQGGDDAIKLRRIYSDYSDRLMEWSQELIGPEGTVQDFHFQSGIVPQHGRGWRSLLPDLAAFDSEVISLSGRPAITLATPGDPRNSVNTPLDTYENIKPYLDNVRRSAVVSAYILKQTADVPVIPLNGRVPSGKIGSVFGRAIEQSLTTYVPTVDIADAVVGARISRKKSMMGVKGRVFARSDVHGFFEIFGFSRSSLLDGFKLAPADGAIEYTAKSDPAVISGTRRKRQEWELRRTDVRLNFFKCDSTTLFDLNNPLTLGLLPGATGLRSEANTELGKGSKSFIGTQVSGTSYTEPLAVFFTKPDRRVKFLLSGGGLGNAGVLLNVPVALARKDKAVQQKNAKDLFLGKGFATPDRENYIYKTAYQVAKDMQLLDYYRLFNLEKAAISKKNLWEMHEEAMVRLTAAERALQEKNYDVFYRQTRMAWSKESRVYPDARGTAHDVVRGVVFYFALLLPFVIFIERLLINYVDVRKKLGAIAILFAFSYLVLRMVHPAFQLSRTPIIILDGFFMLVASIWTIGYLIMRFQTVMETIQQHINTIHRADVARASAAMAAFILGISNMRKRKIRTALTALTLILLTFTILSFTSFETMPARLLEYQSDTKAPYNGLLLRNTTWSALGEFQSYDVANHFTSEGFTVAERSWFVSRDKTVELKLEISRPGTKSGYTIASAMLGLSPKEKHFSEMNKFLAGGKWFQKKHPDWPFVCIIPQSMAESLQITTSEVGEAQINVLGRRLTVVGITGGAEMFAYEDLDGEPITPVDFMQQQQKGPAQKGAGGAWTATGEQTAEGFLAAQRVEDKESDYIHMNTDRVLVIPNDLCLRMGGTFRAIVAGAKDQKGSGKLVRSFTPALEEFASSISMPLYAGIDNHITRLATRSQMTMSGMQGLLVPILIAALIVFNTMLGAVYERTDEIQVYASVGLAPIHIGALFFAESCVFAVLGAMLGYLMGQVLSFGLLQVPWLMEGISLNYSSISAVWSALLVMVVVLASTAWPAHMAGKLSVPDETRQMTIEPPTSDVWEILFPFTVSSKEAKGVMAYLREYFYSNDEDSVGNFTADDIKFYSEEDESGHTTLVLEADVWVAPLDMGISQEVEIAAVPDEEEPEITYLYFTITRKSGEFATWHRMNRGFLKDLRKQLLIWRLVTPEEKQRLTEEADEVL